jgi:hypothetical protein
MYEKLRIAPFQIVQKKQYEILVIRESSACALIMEEDHDVSSKMMREQIVQKALKDLLDFAKDMEEDHDVSSKMMTEQIVQKAQ